MLFESSLKECIALLENKGYIIIKPVTGKVKNGKDLARYFWNKIKSRYNIPLSEFNFRMESMYGNTFIQQLSYKGSVRDGEAIKQAILLIDTVYDHIDEYEVYVKVNSLKLFVMRSTYWVIEKAVGYLQDKDAEELYGCSEEEWQAYEQEYSRFLTDKKFNSSTGYFKKKLLTEE